MWFSNARNNFAPFAGFMLIGYEKRGLLERAGEEIDDMVDGVRAGGDASCNESDDFPR